MSTNREENRKENNKDFGPAMAALLILLGLVAAGGYYGYGYWQRQQSAASQPAAQAGRKIADSAEGTPASPASSGSTGSALVAPGGSAQYAPVQITPAQQRLIGVTTGRAEFRTLEKTIRTVGRVDVDETRIAHVHTKFSGWADKVFVDYTLQHVNKGDPLFSIYSPELVSTEEELLLALKGQQTLGNSTLPNVSAGANSLLEATRRRLSLWDISPEQIEEIERTGKVQRSLIIYSPIMGHVMERKVYPSSFVTPETELYMIVDHSIVWVYADIYESDIGLVQLGQHAVVTTEAYPGQVFNGQVNYIWPHMEKETRTLKVRIEFPNSDLKLKPEMYTNVELKIPLGRRLVVPDSAVVDTGARQMVSIVQSPGVFLPRDVRLGARAQGAIEILAGLKAGEEVVTSANFLIDSESQLRAALGDPSLGAGVTGIGGQAPPGGPAAGRQLQIQFHSDPSPPRVGKNNITLTVSDAGGKPVPDGEAKVVFYMPAMPAMGMAAVRSEAALSPSGGGLYRGEIPLSTPGTWQVTVTVEKGGAVLGSQHLTLNAQ